MWHKVSPADYMTLSSMEYRLRGCQQFKNYVFERIVQEGRRRGGPRGSGERAQQDWLQEFLEKEPWATAIGKSTLLAAVTKVWREGSRAFPAQRLDWQNFGLPPRPGWSSYISGSSRITWEEWVKGKSSRSSVPRVTAQQTLSDLFGEEGLLRFHWGTLLLAEEANRLGRQLRKEGVEGEEWLARLTWIELSRQTTWHWRIRFFLEEKKSDHG